MFNPISTATTVRNFWGKYWHQIVRRGVSTWSNALVDFLGISHGTNASSYTQLWFGFLLSGYFHSTSHMILPSPTNINVPERTYRIVAFFVIQAAAITLEDFVKWVWCKRLGFGEGNSKWRNAVGYVWVVGLLWWSVQFPAIAYLRTRVGSENPFPFTVAGRFLEYFPVPPIAR
jgi:hypothetical protein